jgi:hypothetical protein
VLKAGTSLRQSDKKHSKPQMCYFEKEIKEAGGKVGPYPYLGVH